MTFQTPSLVDRWGRAVVAGYTNSPDFPVKHPLQTSNSSGLTAFVTKLDPDGDTLRYSTFLGGTGGDFAFGISVDRNGDAYVTGFTRSLDFPLKSPIQKARGGDQAASSRKLIVKETGFSTPPTWAARGMQMRSLLLAMQMATHL